MKDKEPNKIIFSADESPVPLPSVEDAWADMRKKLDEEMPERALFFIFRKGALFLMLLLLPLGLFWLIRRHGEGDRSNPKGILTRTKDSGRGKEGQNEATKRGNSGRGGGRRKERSALTQQTEGSGLTQRRNGSGLTQRRNGGAMDRLKEKVGEGDRSPIRAKEVADRGRRQDGGTGRTVNAQELRPDGIVAVAGSNIRRAVVDRRLARIGTREDIVVKVNMPHTATPKKTARPDSTRILWAAGLQDSKSFPVGAQQAYNYDANLKKDLWADYIPSPYFQYHISRKIALQTALQLNNPQYTQSVTIFSKKGDSSGGVQYTLDTTVTVRKLYYFNIPIMIYYSPFRSLYLGGGLQFSNLRNGIAFQNNTIHHVGTSSLNDTVTTSTAISLKENRPAYSNLRKTDWRALFEVNYYWKRVTLGLQYQEALGNYLYSPVEGSSGKDRNSSFNIYLRYNLWERRVRVAPKN